MPLYVLLQIDTVVAGLDGVDIVQCSRGVYVKPDNSLEEVKKVTMIVLGIVFSDIP